MTREIAELKDKRLKLEKAVFDLRDQVAHAPKAHAELEKQLFAIDGEEALGNITPALAEKQRQELLYRLAANERLPRQLEALAKELERVTHEVYRHINLEQVARNQIRNEAFRAIMEVLMDDHEFRERLLSAFALSGSTWKWFIKEAFSEPEDKEMGPYYLQAEAFVEKQFIAGVAQ